MKLMIAAEFGSTGADEISWFHRLSDLNGTNPFRLALWPRLMPLQLGGGFPPPELEEVTCKIWEAEVALPGLGFITEMEYVPADAASPLAVSCVEETKVVARGEPARSTCAPLTNPLPWAVIVNAPDETDVGAMLASTGTGFQIVAALLPVAAELAELTALIVTVLELGTAAGAVYIPEELIVPVAELPPCTPFTCQVTAVFDDPVTVALKDCVAPARTLALAGEILTV